MDRLVLGWLWSHDREFLRDVVTLNYTRTAFGSSTASASVYHLVDLGFIVIEKPDKPGLPITMRLVADRFKALATGRDQRGTARVYRAETGAVSDDLEPRRNRRTNRAETGALTAPKPARIEDHVEDQLEDHSLSPESDDSAGRGKRADDSLFSAWWETVPAGHKLDVSAARKAYARAIKSGATTEQLARYPEYVTAAIAARGDRSLVKYPATWLNAGSWADDAMPSPSRSRQSPAAGIDEARRILSEQKAIGQ
jgi:hypothetical protein